MGVITPDDAMYLVADTKEQAAEWVIEINAAVTAMKAPSSMSAMLKQSQGTFVYVTAGDNNGDAYRGVDGNGGAAAAGHGDNEHGAEQDMVQRALQAEKNWKRLFFRMIPSPKCDYITLAYYEHYEDATRHTKLFGDYKLTERVTCSGELHMEGSVWPT